MEQLVALIQQTGRYPSRTAESTLELSFGRVATAAPGRRPGGHPRRALLREWQSWPPDSLDGMPPKRRRLAGWAIFWFILLGGLLGSAAEAAGIAQPWRSLLVVGVLAAIFVPKGSTFPDTLPPGRL
jgi:hypothetical protein